LLVNRQALDARRDLIDAIKALRLTRSALAAAAGWAEPSMRKGSSIRARCAPLDSSG
jgi:hypothetical protein